MELGRCRRLVPLVALAAVGAASLGGPPLLAARSAAWVPPQCPAATASPDQKGGVAWYRLDPSLDDKGTLSAMRLVVGATGAATRTLDLAPESFASGPSGGRVVAGSDDGSRSTLLALDPSRACATVIADETGAVVRSALATPDGSALYEHRVDRATRADLGVWMRPLAGWQTAGPAHQVLDPLSADERYGPVFTTELRLAGDGSLVVSSCSLRLCRDRVLDTMGQVTMTGPAGPALGVVAGRVVAWAPCAGLPCPVVAHGRDGGRTVLVEAAWSATLGGERGDTLVVDDGDGLAALGVIGGWSARLGAKGVAPVDRGSLATSGASASPGEVVLAPGGHVTDPSHITRLTPAVPEVLP
jgi:hypothetical protein